MDDFQERVSVGNDEPQGFIDGAFKVLDDEAYRGAHSNLSFERYHDGGNTQAYGSVSLNNNGDGNLTTNFTAVSDKGNAYISGSADLTMNIRDEKIDPYGENNVSLSAGVRGDFKDIKYQVEAKVSAYGEHLKDIKGLINGTIEKNIGESGLTTAFVQANMSYDDNDTREFIAGIKHGVFEAGVSHNAATDETTPMVGISILTP